MKRFVTPAGLARSAWSRTGPVCAAAIAAALISALPSTAQNVAPKQTLNITAYNINVELHPGEHALDATTQVTFTPLADLPSAIFDLHGALLVDKVTDAKGATLNGERGPGATLVVTPSATLPKGQSVTWTFHYSGKLESDAGGPVEGLKLAYVGEPISYLLYAGRWFPMTGYMTDRFGFGPVANAFASATIAALIVPTAA